MDYILTAGGLLVHARKDWPCAVCRPEGAWDEYGSCLCVDCACAQVAAAEAGLESARAMLGDLTDALGQISARSFQASLRPN
jgi:hypothetical protein